MRIRTSFLGFWQAWKRVSHWNTEELSLVLARKGNGLSQSRGEKCETCWNNRKVSPHAQLPPLATWSLSSGPRIQLFACGLREVTSFLNFQTTAFYAHGHCRHFQTWLPERLTSTTSPLHPTFQHAAREIYLNANLLPSLLSLKSFRTSKYQILKTCRIFFMVWPLLASLALWLFPSTTGNSMELLSFPLPSLPLHLPGPPAPSPAISAGKLPPAPLPMAVYATR